MILSLFGELGLDEDIVSALDDLGFEKPTPIQEEAIPILLNQDTDLIGLAQTGTGKTAAFGLPLIHKIIEMGVLEPVNFTVGLIVAPTRELALQITDQLTLFAKHLPWLRISTVYGGAPITKQLKELRSNPHIVVATPGRLIDLMKRKAAKLKQAKFLILDEADEMFNMGFKDEVDEILENLTEGNYNTWLFTATMAKPVRAVISDYMTHPKELKVSSGQQVNENITHQYTVLKKSDKLDALTRFLDLDQEMRTIIFCRTKLDTQEVAERLTKKGYKAGAIHGDLTQQLRERVMRQFKSHDLEILVATDVAARGIDVNDITHVVHHTLPDDSAFYSHRSGRTARAGKKGISLAFVSPRDGRKRSYIEKDLKISMAKVMIPSLQEIRVSRIQNWLAAFIEKEPNTALTQHELIEQAKESLMGLKKEELINRLLSDKFAALLSNKHERDLNQEEGGSGRGRERGGRDRGGRDRGGRDRNRRGAGRRDSRGGRDRDRGGRDRDRGGSRDRGSFNPRSGGAASEDSDAFFINIGRKDGADKAQLLEFIVDQTNLRKADITRVKLLDKHSYFDVDSAFSSKVSGAFSGVNINGRKVKVNRDHPKND